MSLADALERGASALAPHAEAIRDANGDPERLLETLAPGAASELLGWLLANEPAAGEELALAWSEVAAGVEPIARLEGAPLPKPGGKIVRKALHRLRSRGVALAERPSEPVVARPRAVSDDFEAALVSPLDRRGARMAYLVEPHPAGGARMYEAVLDDVRGIVDFRVYSAGRSRVRSFLKSAVDSRGDSGASALLDVTTSELRALIARAAKRQPAGHPVPSAFIEHRSQLGLAGHATTPGDRARSELAGLDAGPAIEAVAARVRDAALGPWPPGEGALRRIAERVRDRVGPDAGLEGEAREEAVRGLAAEIARDVFAVPGDGFASATASRLCETAFVLRARGLESEARELVAAAGALESGAADSALARAFVELWIAPLAASLAPRPPGEPAAEGEARA